MINVYAISTLWRRNDGKMSHQMTLTLAETEEALRGLVESLCVHEGEDILGRVAGTWSRKVEDKARWVCRPRPRDYAAIGE